jgi:hypothetical protein
MFDFQKIKESVAAAMLAVLLSTTAVTAAVGPARAIETDSSLQAGASARV